MIKTNGIPNTYNLKDMMPWAVMVLAVAPVVIPAATAAIPMTELETAPPNLSSKGRTDKVSDSSRWPNLSCPYSTQSVIVIKTTKNTNGCGMKKSSAATKTIANEVPAIVKTPIPQSMMKIQMKKRFLLLILSASLGKSDTDNNPTKVLMVPSNVNWAAWPNT